MACKVSDPDARESAIATASTGEDGKARAVDRLVGAIIKPLILGRSDQLEGDVASAVSSVGRLLEVDVLFVDAHSAWSPPHLRAAYTADPADGSGPATAGAGAGPDGSTTAGTDLDVFDRSLADTVAAQVGNDVGSWMVADVASAALEHPALSSLAARGLESALLAPLRHGDVVVGVCAAGSRRARRWTAEECTSLSLIAEVMGAVIVRRAAEHGPAGGRLRYRDILDDQTEMICRFTPDLRVTYANQAYAVQYGHSSESIIGHSLLEFFPEDKHEWAINQVARMGRDLLVNHHENEVVFADGSRSWFQWTDTVALDADGEVAEIQAVGRNVTESHRLAEAMRRSEERFRRAFEDAPIGMAVLDDGNHVLRANQALTRFLGVDQPGELRGHVLSDLVAPADRREAASSHGELRGEVRFLRADGTTRWAEISFSRFDVDEQETFRLMQVVDLDDRKRIEEQLEHEALHDPLTGLPNRTLLLDRLGVALQRRDRGEGHVAVLFGDLDQFKLVNDSFGHEVGDRLLRLVAQRLSRALRSHDTLARFGGDEFVVLAEGLESPQAGKELARRLIASLAEPLNLGVAEVSVGVSLGIAMAEDGATPSDLVRRADTAMYAAKDGERPRIAFYDGGLERQAAGRLSLQTELSRAMDNDEFVPVYQPLVDANGVAVGVEALVRWDRGDAGMEGPANFLNVAEDMGLIVPLGTRILERACHQTAEWSATSGRKIQAWVNVSGREMTHHGFVAAVERCLAVSGLVPGQLCLELTEWTVLSDMSAVARTMASLQELGVRFALDDFGTGYSALDFLRRFPLNAVKIDRAFVGGLLDHGETDRALVTAIADLGVALGLDVVGEGVENEEQARVLRELGVPLLQGFQLAHPALPERLGHWFLPRDDAEAAA